MIGLIGNTGFIGKSLTRRLSAATVFNSTNIESIAGQHFDTLYCCAPSGNRLYANQNEQDDYNNVMKLVSSLESTFAQRVVLISTVDTQHCPDTPYGQNRLILEQFVKTLPCYNIARLCTLIDPEIKKNVLYDLKNHRFIESINLEQVQQWYRLSDLIYHLESIIYHNIKEVNLVSEPIATKDIVDRFFKNLNLTMHNPVKAYNLTCDATEIATNGYVYTCSQVLNFIEDYLYA